MSSLFQFPTENFAVGTACPIGETGSNAAVLEDAVSAINALFIENERDLRDIVLAAYNFRFLSAGTKQQLFCTVLSQHVGNYPRTREGVENRIIFEIKVHNKCLDTDDKIYSPDFCDLSDQQVYALLQELRQMRDRAEGCLH